MNSPNKYFSELIEAFIYFVIFNFICSSLMSLALYIDESHHIQPVLFKKTNQEIQEIVKHTVTLSLKPKTTDIAEIEKVYQQLQLEKARSSSEQTQQLVPKNRQVERIDKTDWLKIAFLIGGVMLCLYLSSKIIPYLKLLNEKRRKALNVEQVMQISQNDYIAQCLAAIESAQELNFKEASPTEVEIFQEFQSTIYLILNVVLLRGEATEKTSVFLHSKPIVSYFNLCKYEKVIARFEAIYETWQESRIILSIALDPQNYLREGLSKTHYTNWMKPWTQRNNAELLLKEEMLQRLIDSPL